MSKKNYFKERIMLLILLFAFMTPFGALAQTIQLTGLVTDAANEPIIGASVVEKGTTNGVITDFDGNFALSVSPKATIIISYVGYATQEVPVNGKTNIRVTLKEDTEMLDEVVVVGYGTMKKSDMTGAISSVDVDDLVKRTTTNPAEALQGKIAGVNIMKAGGNAGAGHHAGGSAHHELQLWGRQLSAGTAGLPSAAAGHPYGDHHRLSGSPPPARTAGPHL